MVIFVSINIDRVDDFPVAGSSINQMLQSGQYFWVILPLGPRYERPRVLE